MSAPAAPPRSFPQQALNTLAELQECLVLERAARDAALAAAREAATAYANAVCAALRAADAEGGATKAGEKGKLS